MFLTTDESLIFIFTIALATFLTRVLPFMIFRDNKKTPPYITYLGGVLPFAIIGMLVVYCLKDVSIVTAPFAVPEFIAVTAIVLVHLWRENTLLSIGGGTILYMALVQFVFV